MIVEGEERRLAIAKSVKLAGIKTRKTKKLE
jgi:hypothetical protein